MATPVLAHLESLLRARRLDGTLGASQPPHPDAPEPASSGLAWLDERLGGGWPRGQVSELVGPRSSGRSWLAAQTMARATRQGELAALVAEHPESDFLVSREVVEKLDQHTSHEIRRITPELVLLYSKTKLPPVTPRWTCAM